MDGYTSFQHAGVSGIAVLGVVVVVFVIVVGVVVGVVVVGVVIVIPRPRKFLIHVFWDRYHWRRRCCLRLHYTCCC